MVWAVLSTLLALALQASAAQTQAPAPAGRGQQPPSGPFGLGRRGGPPQPQQHQGIEYFVGAWTFTYSGRESPVSMGPRAGTITFTRKPGGNALDVRTEGRGEGGDAFEETGSFEWNDRDKVMTIKERLATGTELVSAGDWSSPLTIRAESRPVNAGGQSVRIRRLYSIVSAQAFTLSEEISIAGGPFERLGAGRFSKSN